MTENQPPATNGDAAGVPFYEKQRQMLHSMINKKRLLERSLANIEDNIAKKESEYLEDTPNGNIITGFEGYTKGTTAAPGQRRRGAIQETNKVFSRSSVTYNLNAETPVETASSTPVAAMAPTPLSTSFIKGDSGSNHATPTSSKSGAGKKNKKGVNGDDSDTDTRESKKVRTNFGVSRK